MNSYWIYEWFWQWNRGYWENQPYVYPRGTISRKRENISHQWCWESKPPGRKWWNQQFTRNCFLKSQGPRTGIGHIIDLQTVGIAPIPTCNFTLRTLLGGGGSNKVQGQRTNIPISKDQYPNIPFSKDRDPTFKHLNPSCKAVLYNQYPNMNIPNSSWICQYPSFRGPIS